MNRYDVSRLDEAQFEPGPRGRVLKNLLGICRVREMNMIEAEKLAPVKFLGHHGACAAPILLRGAGVHGQGL